MIAIMDYGMGNLRSVQKAFEKVGYAATISSSPEEILRADGVVLPGVGAFGDAMDSLNSTGLADVARHVAEEGRPFLGVCLGQQLLFSESEENFDGSASVKGLGLIPGKVVRFTPGGRGLKVPQIGWNEAIQTGNAALFNGIPDGSFFYFVHSYYVVPDDEAVVSTWTEYGIRFASSVAQGNLFAAQFHPEKSSRWGLEMYRNFGGLVDKCC